jgi:hypothetical protein
MKNVVVVVCLLSLLAVSYIAVIGFSFPINQLPKSFMVTVIVNNENTELCDIFASDEQYLQIKHTLQNNNSGWKVDINSYMPTLRLYSESMSIVMLDGWWVVNFRHEYFGWIQLSKELESKLNKGNVCERL